MEGAPRSRGRAPRAAATAATAALHQYSGSDSDSGSRAKERAPSPVYEAAPLTAYEIERERSMSKNHAELVALGLAAATRPAAPRARPAKQARRSAREHTAPDHDDDGGSSGRSGGSDGADSDAAYELPASAKPRKKSRAQPPPVAAAAGSSSMSDEDCRSYFRLLAKGGHLLTTAQLRLWMADVGGEEISADQADAMVDCFDQGGRGGLDFAEFCDVVQRVQASGPI